MRFRHLAVLLKCIKIVFILQSETCVFYPKEEITTRPRKRVQPYTASCVKTRFSPVKHCIQYGQSSEGCQ